MLANFIKPQLSIIVKPIAMNTFQTTAVKPMFIPHGCTSNKPPISSAGKMAFGTGNNQLWKQKTSLPYDDPYAGLGQLDEGTRALIQEAHSLLYAGAYHLMNLIHGRPMPALAGAHGYSMPMQSMPPSQQGSDTYLSEMQSNTANAQQIDFPSSFDANITPKF